MQCFTDITRFTMIPVAQLNRGIFILPQSFILYAVTIETAYCYHYVMPYSPKRLKIQKKLVYDLYPCTHQQTVIPRAWADQRSRQEDILYSYQPVVNYNTSLPKISFNTYLQLRLYTPTPFVTNDLVQ